MRAQILSVFLCLLVSLGAAQAQLKVDFTVTGGPVEAGYQGYFATRGQPATFTAQSYSAFGTTITIKPTLATGAANTTYVTINRTGSANNRYTGAHANLINTWIGLDNRTAGNPMTLTISSLPAGAYKWVSYHHDGDNQTGQFDVTVNDAPGSVTTAGLDISDSRTSGVVAFENITHFATKIVSDGKTDVTLVFKQLATGGATAFFVMNGFELTDQATEPVPTVGASDVRRDGTTLSWTPNTTATGHDVYLGTNYDAIDDGTTASAAYMGRQDANSFNPGRLQLRATYYWRVDEVLSAGRISKGDIWSFTVEPVAILLTGDRIQATASSSNSADEGPGKTVDGSGLTADTHSTTTTEMWLSSVGDANAAWIRYEFDKVYKLHQMLVWNHNSPVEATVGLGVKEATIEYSLDGVAWTTLGTTHVIDKASGTPTYAGSAPIEFGDVAAKFVRISTISNWGGLKQYGLSEVRFMIIPMHARQPQPANAAAGINPPYILSWRPGRGAVTHEVFMSTDVNAVTSDAAKVGTVSEPRFDATNVVRLGQTFYWKVVEVNSTEEPAAWDGDVWSFTPVDLLAVENFESYGNTSPNRVFQAWIDGVGFSEDEFFPKDNPGNGSGAMVGYDPTKGDIMEAATVHGGLQSMPLAYDSSAVAYSETERAFADPQDWTRFGVKALVLWFCGNSTNTATQMYVKVNGRKVLYDGDAENILRKPWHLWYIPLTQFTGTDLTKVTKLAIGFEGGSGLVFFDDIGLSPLDPQSVTPAKPDATSLMAYYAMEGNANDSAGGPAGTLGGAPTFAAGKSGQAIKLNGAGDYVLVTRPLDLPVYSAALWFKVEGGTGNRDLLSIFNDAALHGALLEVTGAGGLRFLHRGTVGVATGDVNARNNGKFDDGAWYHVAIVKSADTATLYVNGEQAGSAASTTPFDQALTQTALGMLKYPISASDTRYFPGQIDEVYLYGRALSQGEVAWLAGLTKPIAK